MATFFDSSRVKIFPCYNRGELIKVAETETTVQPIDPESKLSTEYNFTHIPGLFMGYDSYTIENTAQVFRGVIHGYYIEIAHGTNQTLDGKLVICEHTYTIYKNKTFNEARTSTRLAPITITSSGGLEYQSTQVELDVDGKCIAVAYIAKGEDYTQPANFYSLDLDDPYRKIVTFAPNPSVPDNTVHSLKLIEDLRTTATSGVKTLYYGANNDAELPDPSTDEFLTLTKLNDRLDVIEGEDTGSVKKAEANAKAYTDTVVGNYYTPAVGEEGSDDYSPAKEASGLRKDIAEAKSEAISTANGLNNAMDGRVKTLETASTSCAESIERIEEIIGVPATESVDATGLYSLIAAETTAREAAIGTSDDDKDAETVYGAIADLREDLDTLTGKDGDEDTTSVNGLCVRMNNAEGDIEDLQAEFNEGGRVKVAENDIDALEDIVAGYAATNDDPYKTVKAHVDAVSARAEKGITDAATAQSAAEAAASAASVADGKAVDAQTRVGVLENTTVPGVKTIAEDAQTRVKAIEDDYLTEADKYDDTALAGRVETAEGKIADLEAAVQAIDYVDADELADVLKDFATDTDLETGLALKADKTALEALAAKLFDTYATKSEVKAVDAKFADYTKTSDLNTALEAKADTNSVVAKDTFETFKDETTTAIATAKDAGDGAAQAVKTLAEGQVATNTSNIAIANGTLNAILDMLTQAGYNNTVITTYVCMYDTDGTRSSVPRIKADIHKKADKFDAVALKMFEFKDTFTSDNCYFVLDETDPISIEFSSCTFGDLLLESSDSTTTLVVYVYIQPEPQE